MEHALYVYSTFLDKMSSHVIEIWSNGFDMQIGLFIIYFEIEESLALLQLKLKQNKNRIVVIKV